MQAGSGTGGHGGGENVVRVAVEVLAGSVVTHGGARVGVPGSDLHVSEVDASVEHDRDERERSMCGCALAKAAWVLAALKRDGWIETRRSGSHRVLVKGDQQHIWTYHDGVDWAARPWPGSPATTATPLLSCGSHRTIW